jgi:hypothetical protein
VHDESELESETTASVAPVSAPQVPVQQVVHRRARAASHKRLNSRVRLHVGEYVLDWRRALATEMSSVLLICRRMPAIVYAAVAGFVLGLIVSRRSSRPRHEIGYNLPLSYFAHKSPLPPPHAMRAPATRRYGAERRARAIPAGSRLVPVATGARRFIEI